MLLEKNNVSAKKIIITGGPGTGKTSVIKSLSDKGYICFPEVSRQITLEARKEGVDQLFLEDPLLFSQKLLEGRTSQFLEANKYFNETIFIDRGIPDIIAYMDYTQQQYPDYFTEACEKYIYDTIFLLPPWEAIYVSDEERYENFEQAVAIHDYLEKAYIKCGYDLIDVPTGKVDFRVNFIENVIKNN